MQIDMNPMQAQDVETAVSLIAAAMNPDEARWARETFEFYFGCLANEIDPARHYFTARSQTTLCGLVGLHHYRWGPAENIWLSWFAVSPEYQGQQTGSLMLDYIEGHARQSGYKQLLIETYSRDEFAHARKFYLHKGYTPVGEIRGYLDDDSSMLVYCKRL